MRALVSFDGQNLYRLAMRAYGPGPPYTWPSYDVVKLAEALVSRVPDRALAEVLKTTATMTTTNNLDALFADAEPPFGHPGRRFDDTSEYFDPTPLLGQGPEPDYTPDEEDSVIHYAPDDHPLCGTESLTAVFTDDPATVAGCVDCLELAAEDLDEDNEHWADCLHCQQEISAQNGLEWRRLVRRPCPHCGRPGW